MGIYVEAQSPVAARALKLISPTLHWDAQVYASNGTPATLSEWGPRLGSVANVGQTAQIPITTAGQKFRRYLLWIVKLPNNQQRVQISELTLLR